MIKPPPPRCSRVDGLRHRRESWRNMRARVAEHFDLLLNPEAVDDAGANHPATSPAHSSRSKTSPKNPYRTKKSRAEKSRLITEGKIKPR